MLCLKQVFGKRKFKQIESPVLLLVLGILLVYTYLKDGCAECPIETSGRSTKCDSQSTNSITKRGQRGLKTDPIPVILVTHARTGSSFTGEVLQKSRSVFYVYEPFYNIKLSIKQKRMMLYVNGTSRYFGPKDYSELATDILKNILTCRIENIPLNVWQGHYSLKSKSTMPMYSCMKSKYPASCVMKLKSPCQNSLHVLIKTIRVPMFVVEPLMNEMPSLKVIHLIRDPRAIIKSWMKFDWIKLQSLTESSIKICNEIYDNIMMFEHLQRHYRKQVYKATYEDIARNPVVEFSKLYTFTKMEYTKTVKDFVIAITSSRKAKKCGSFCNIRNNSTVEADRWRTDIKLDVVKIIDTSCVQLYRKVGYNEILDERMLRDLTHKLTYTPTEASYNYG